MPTYFHIFPVNLSYARIFSLDLHFFANLSHDLFPAGVLLYLGYREHCRDPHPSSSAEVSSSEKNTKVNFLNVSKHSCKLSCKYPLSSIECIYLYMTFGLCLVGSRFRCYLITRKGPTENLLFLNLWNIRWCLDAQIFFILETNGVVDRTVSPCCPFKPPTALSLIGSGVYQVRYLS